MFEIHGERYESEIDADWTFGGSSNDMNIKLKNVIGLNDKIEYEYDFGSTTYLEIKVIDKIVCSNKGKSIELIARNNEPELKCSNCGSKASYYDHENEEYLCDDCFEDYTGDEEMIEELDYVNSPRAGVCGYHGSKEDEDKYLPNVKSGKLS
jgi:DNA-directed RNA polymerase subunit RPC12/RpoP